MAAEPAVRFEDVSFSYDGMPVLKGAGFALAPSDLACLVGRSGSGKTTLLRLAHGQLRPNAGRLEVRRPAAMAFQDGRLLPSRTAIENVAYAVRVADLRLGSGEAVLRARAALRDVGLDDRAGAYPRQLSLGQRQRVAVARAVASRPAVLLADEPTASLDAPGADAVLALLRRLARTGTAVLLATCDRELAEFGRRSGGRVLELHGGEVIEESHEGRSRCAAS